MNDRKKDPHTDGTYLYTQEEIQKMIELYGDEINRRVARTVAYHKRMRRYHNRNRNRHHNKIKFTNKKTKQGLSKGAVWWRTLSPKEQADWRYEKAVGEGQNPNWQAIYAQVIREGNYRR